MPDVGKVTSPPPQIAQESRACWELPLPVPWPSKPIKDVLKMSPIWHVWVLPADCPAGQSSATLYSILWEPWGPALQPGHHRASQVLCVTSGRNPPDRLPTPGSPGQPLLSIRGEGNAAKRRIWGMEEEEERVKDDREGTGICPLCPMIFEHWMA